MVAAEDARMLDCETDLGENTIETTGAVVCMRQVACLQNGQQREGSAHISECAHPFLHDAFPLAQSIPHLLARHAQQLDLQQSDVIREQQLTDAVDKLVDASAV